MKIISIVIALVLLTATMVKAEDVTKWTTTDTVLQLTFFTLMEVDREQTQWIASHQYETRTMTTTFEGGHTRVVGHQYAARKEGNSIIGTSAHPDRINAYFAGTAVAHTVIAYFLPHIIKACGGNDSVAKWSRTAWQSTWIIAEGYTVGKNINVGVKTTF